MEGLQGLMPSEVPILQKSKPKTALGNIYEVVFNDC